MASLFISDLHISPETPAIYSQLLHLLTHDAQQADELYILGDLFEAWLGDDVIPDSLNTLLSALKSLSEKIPVYFMHGNRDFLIGNQFEKLTGCQILPDPCVKNIQGTPTLLMHGDLLCTDDIDYMKLRVMVRDPLWQAQFLSMDLTGRITLAKQAREASHEKTKQTAAEIMDANPDTVQQYFNKHNVTRLIHGHTHRPAIHRLTIQDQAVERIVLGDWGNTTSLLWVEKDKITLHDARVA